MVLVLLGSIGCRHQSLTGSNDSGDTAISGVDSSIQLQDPQGSDNTAPDSGNTGSASSSPSSESSAKPASPTITPIPTVTVLIPEGFTASQIGDRLEAKGVCKKADFLNMINSYDFSYYPLVAKIPVNPNRCYKLEGYLYPNTYLFYLAMKPQDVIGKMLRQAEDKIGSTYDFPGMSTDEIITLASIIQKEAANLTDMKNVSSVFHNRLKRGMQLQADPTIYYVEQYLKPNLTGDINRFNAYYNTYKCKALPSGAICNPGSLALQAAVSPADTTFLYFVTDKAGTFYYANTWEEHVANCVKAGVLPPATEPAGSP